MTAQAIEIQGHRGARGLLPENTIPAFERAIDLGVDVLELDLGMTPHGFRSSFRDWCAESAVSRELAESCLAHVVKNTVEAAYRRSDLLQQRREVMSAWGRYIA